MILMGLSKFEKRSGLSNSIRVSFLPNLFVVSLRSVAGLHRDSVLVAYIS